MRRLYFLIFGLLVLCVGVFTISELSIRIAGDTVPSPGLQPYSEVALRGRQVYIENGCLYCHTQQVRPLGIDSPYLHGTRPSLPNDYVYDRPHLMGTERQGPDLTNIGRKYLGAEGAVQLSMLLRNPRLQFANATMPSFDFLSDRDRSDLVVYLQTLGAWKEPYDGPIERWTYDYLRDVPNLTQETIDQIDGLTEARQVTTVNVLMLVWFGLAVVLPFFLAWRSGQFRDLEAPALQLSQQAENPTDPRAGE
ncbi:cbb3-type cytochrome c oxidase subunit II [Synechococcus elongatus]|uniref:Cytochrome c domain-containing protein n=2 Tax=Synechococcus elongatus TaxID=32046 RepID=Q31RT6_SYNE7|nr:cbb3-type cytochrome c oxidase subunit II [Synechococcus elongatus]ABB56233.1 conserved hypothetical protein [Synechococcus elongatus PCC 7942 = FACHB-805]AJD56716.1 hypothetical protein M744_02050 [Synechococcus elongatus UTEX 2973]MBD2588065.1 cbb3-type cytochrome c oxidase subunit II [Synechococcus elongatus FACHB-242]MBD2689133.1 cbb3-type cytochrome c oxidase subunit II [Synechococcus elongatus FACHB-1061]MBD2707227.1 cbb3-type cytochrome c oxidase subunit II [Synechococcus elongatus P